MMNALSCAIAFTFGSVVGSFLNVVILRFPQGESIVFPPSRCPGCGNPIKFYDNIPIISFIFLGGKCRNCKDRISFQYPLVELLTGVGFLAVFIRFGISSVAIIYFALISVLIVISAIDLKHRIIPNLLSLPGIPLGFLASFFLPEITAADSLAGILLGGGTLYLVAVSYFYLRRKEGMGGGDIKLLAMLGGFIGVKGVLFTILMGSLLGALGGIFMMGIGREGRYYAIPFGPFLSAASILYIFFGRVIIGWYLGLIEI